MVILRALIVAAIAGCAGRAVAQTFTPVATVTSHGGGVAEPRVVGDHYVGLDIMTCDGDDCHVDIANTQSLAIERVHASRARLARKLGHAGAMLEARLVSYDGDRAGLMIAGAEPGSSHWYAELDARTGAVVRATRLAPWSADVDVYPVTADLAHHAVWFAAVSFDGPRREDLHFARERSARSLALRRIDLADLATADVATLALPARLQAAPLEDDVSIHVSPDGAHVAVVEYFEEPHHLSPPASAYVIDTATGASFAVPVPEVVYAAAFSPDGKYLVMSSAVTGEIRRVDLHTHAADLVVRGPKQTHQAFVTPNGKRVAVLGSSPRYVALDLPGLGHASELAGDARLASSMGGAPAAITPDSLIVVALPFGATLDQRDYAIVRLGN